MAKEDNNNSSSSKAKKTPKKRSFSLPKLNTKKSDKQKSKPKQSDGNFLTGYLKGAYSELKKVAWPDRKESIRLTIGVIVYSLAFALFIALVDYIFDLGFERFIV